MAESYSSAYAANGTAVDAALQRADTAVQPGDTIPIADGGTGATTAAAARTNLELVKQTDANDRTPGRIVIVDHLDQLLNGLQPNVMAPMTLGCRPLSSWSR